MKTNNQEEIWLPIKNYENLYDVSNLGRVYSHRTKKILKPSEDKVGYKRTTLQKTHRKDVKRFYIHQLVAIAFLENQENKKYINHKDENKSNNNVDNLEWVTHKENCNFGTRNKKISVMNKNNKFLSKKVICLNNNIVYPSMQEASRQTGVPSSNISKCCNKERKQAGGLKWAII